LFFIFYNNHNIVLTSNNIALRMIDHITSHIFYTTLRVRKITLRVRKITAAVNKISLKYLISTPTSSFFVIVGEKVYFTFMMPHAMSPDLYFLV